MPTSTDEGRDWKISAKTSWWDFNPKEIWSYRRLLVGLVSRDLLKGYVHYG